MPKAVYQRVLFTCSAYVTSTFQHTTLSSIKQEHLSNTNLCYSWEAEMCNFNFKNILG